MTVASSESHVPSAPEPLEIGGLQFATSFRGAGATLRVYGDVDGRRTELLRFDDFIESPHYHVPAAADPIPLDRSQIGEPLAWYIGQLREHLGDMLVAGGYGELLDRVDLAAVTAEAGRIEQAMIDVVPDDGYIREPGVGLQRVGSAQ